jgi:predicted  nucleic acid-binding Zn-ribbon protein
MVPLLNAEQKKRCLNLLSKFYTLSEEEFVTFSMFRDQDKKIRTLSDQNIVLSKQIEGLSEQIADQSAMLKSMMEMFKKKTLDEPSQKAELKRSGSGLF